MKSALQSLSRRGRTLSVSEWHLASYSKRYKSTSLCVLPNCCQGLLFLFFFSFAFLAFFKALGLHSNMDRISYCDYVLTYCVCDMYVCDVSHMLTVKLDYTVVLEWSSRWGDCILYPTSTMLLSVAWNHCLSPTLKAAGAGYSHFWTETGSTREDLLVCMMLSVSTLTCR